MNSIPLKKDSPVILVVDDEKFLQIQLRELMEQAGYPAVQANNGEQALKVYSSFYPDLVLLDTLMPVMNSFTCCAKLQELPESNRPPVLMLIAPEQQELVERAFAVGASDVDYKAD